MSVFLTRLLDELADEIYPEGRQFIDTDSATFHVHKEWANKLRAIRAAVGGEAVDVHHPQYEAGFKAGLAFEAEHRLFATPQSAPEE